MASLLTNQTTVSPGSYFFALSGSGGGGGGNLTVSTITLQGSTAPITATLPSGANDGFEVRNGGGGSNVITITTIDAGNPAQAEMGIRTLSTISGTPIPRGRFEQVLVPSNDTASLSYTLDKVGAGNASTIGSVVFTPGSGGAGGYVSVKGEGGSGVNIGNGAVVATPSGSDLVQRKAAVASGGNIYVPAAGTAVNIAQFSTIAGHTYELSIPNLRVQNQPAGAPAAGAWAQLNIPDASPIYYLDTFDMASVSTIANDLQKCPRYIFTASGTAHTLSANGSLANTLSTAITISPAFVYLRDLGIQSGMPTIG